MFPEFETSTYFGFQVNVLHTVSIKNNENILHCVCVRFYFNLKNALIDELKTWDLCVIFH